MRLTPPERLNSLDTGSQQTNFLIRPAIPSDIEDFHELAKLAGAGFTSMPVNEALLAERLLTSANAFVGGPGILTLALEDTALKRVVGCAAVKPGGRARSDFLNFQIDHDQNILIPTSRYADMTEVGSLLLHPDYRSGGVGPWLARSRYLLIATHPDRFGSHIFSELRGLVDDDDYSPFYDAVCAPYFKCSFAEADDLCAHGRQAELNALLPEHPLSFEKLHPAALDAMAQTHSAGRRALDFLEAEGFRFEGVVDLLDGGPAVVAESYSVQTISQSFETSLRIGSIDEERSVEADIAIGGGADFRCYRTRASLDVEGSIRCSSRHLSAFETKAEIAGRIRINNLSSRSFKQLEWPRTDPSQFGVTTSLGFGRTR